MGLDALLSKLEGRNGTSGTSGKIPGVPVKPLTAKGCTSATLGTSKKNVMTGSRAGIIHINSEAAQSSELPAWCRPDCSFLESIEAIGNGCVQRLPGGGEEWQRLDTLPGCTLSDQMAIGYGCGSCGNRVYLLTANGWRCEGCGEVYLTIGGSRGPVLITVSERAH